MLEEFVLDDLNCRAVCGDFDILHLKCEFALVLDACRVLADERALRRARKSAALDHGRRAVIDDVMLGFASGRVDIRDFRPGGLGREALHLAEGRLEDALRIAAARLDHEPVVDPEGVLQTTFRKVKCLAAEFTGPKIAYAYSSGHESEHDVIYDGASVTIKGNRLGDATGCAFICKDKTGVEHKSDYGADFSISEDGTQIVISDTMTVAHMRENCTAAMSELDVDAGATVKLTLSDGTELTHHVSFGE